MTFSAALIDMDGVLYDSMAGHADSWQAMMAAHGFKTQRDEFFLYEGMTGAAVIDLIIRRELGRPATQAEMDSMYREKTELFRAGGQRPPIQGAQRMVSLLGRAGITRVLVTGSSQPSLLDSLNTDYPGAFPADRRVTGHDVTHGKPHPEPYLRGAAKAGAEPQQCLVVENAPLGVRAGKAAGCFTVAVTTGPIPRSAFEKEGADLIFDSMDHFADWLQQNLTPTAPGTSPSADPTPGQLLDQAVSQLNPATVTVVTDSNVDRLVLPLLSDSQVLATASKVVIPPGEDHKNLESVTAIWMALEQAGATRRSLVVNIGGGLVTDIGGFAAATYKRGIAVINLPTSLLGAVDAATGGKTGINFNGLKNEIGAFHLPAQVIISALPLATLPPRELMSGYAEMLKTGLIADADLYNSLLDVAGVTADTVRLERAMKRCVDIKDDVVRQDPKEKGLRKILNFGHTAGHAFESMSIAAGRSLTHGEAVAHGILVELILSHDIMGFASADVHRYATFLKENYPRIPVTCDDMPRLIQLMSHDKKNASAGHPNFTLLREPGVPQIDCLPPIKEIEAALDIYRDMMG